MAVLLGRQDLSEAVKSDFAKNKIITIANNKYLDQARGRRFTSNLFKRLWPKWGNIDFTQIYPMELYSDVKDPTNPLYERGDGFDVH